VLTALSQACDKNLSAFVALVMEMGLAASESPQKLDEAAVVRKMEEALLFLQNACELLRWIYPNTSERSLSTALRVVALLRKTGCSDEEANAVLKKIGRKSAGRPATKRHIAIRGKEMRLADPKRWTWPKITEALCDCGKDHDIVCQDNLRREILHFEKVLSKFGCIVEPPREKQPGVSPMR
jgi:hypothetical protein